MIWLSKISTQQSSVTASFVEKDLKISSMVIHMFVIGYPDCQGREILRIFIVTVVMTRIAKNLRNHFLEFN